MNGEVEAIGRTADVRFPPIADLRSTLTAYTCQMTIALVSSDHARAALGVAAIDKHGCACWVCEFDFEAAYGPLGAGCLDSAVLGAGGDIVRPVSG